MNKQTAVEFYAEQDNLLTLSFLNDKITDAELLSLKKMLLEKCKQMEKEQHGDTWDDAIKANERRSFNLMRSLTDFDDYYNRKYTSNNEE
jgi:hypothetical protein